MAPATGIINLLKEFESELVGIGVLVDNIETRHKLIEDYISIILFKGINKEGKSELTPSNFFEKV